MRILQQGPGWVALEKPAGFHVHPPESGDFKVPRDRVALYVARDLLRTWVYPVHRLDVSTVGVLVMALNPQAASFLAKQFQERRVRKTYHAVVRGWTPDEQLVDIPLELDSTGDLAESRTRYRTLARLELPRPVGKRHASARYSLLEVKPETGRFHQIRRHMNRISHPIVGDAAHGDSHHNRFFREELGFEGLCLKAHDIEFTEPDGGTRAVVAPDNEKWTGLRALFAGEEAPRTSPLERITGPRTVF